MAAASGTRTLLQESRVLQPISVKRGSRAISCTQQHTEVRRSTETKWEKGIALSLAASIVLLLDNGSPALALQDTAVDELKPGTKLGVQLTQPKLKSRFGPIEAPEKRKVSKPIPAPEVKSETQKPELKPAEKKQESKKGTQKKKSETPTPSVKAPPLKSLAPEPKKSAPTPSVRAQPLKSLAPEPKKEAPTPSVKAPPLKSLAPEPKKSAPTPPAKAASKQPKKAAPSSKPSKKAPTLKKSITKPASPDAKSLIPSFSLPAVSLPSVSGSSSDTTEALAVAGIELLLAVIASSTVNALLKKT